MGDQRIISNIMWNKISHDTAIRKKGVDETSINHVYDARGDLSEALEID